MHNIPLLTQPKATELKYQINYKLFILGERLDPLELQAQALKIPLAYSSEISDIFLGIKDHIETEEKAVLILFDHQPHDKLADPHFWELKDYCQHNGVPIILITKGFRLNILNKALDLGIDDVFFQPVKLSSLFKRINFLFNFKKNKLNYLAHNTNQEHEIHISPLKRAFDIFVSVSVLLALSPLLLVVILLIYIESPGPVFYASKRVGAGYKIFDFYKLRSMKIGADQLLNSIKNQNQYAKNHQQSYFNHCENCLEGKGTCSPYLFSNNGKILCEKHIQFLKEKEKLNTFIKVEKDPRITKIGKFIRNTSIDELPQLINVLKGDMSIVGNRPLPLYEAEKLTTDQSSKRFFAPAGITGLWQVSKRGKGEMSQEERIALDNEYAEKNNFWYDMGLILKTIPALLQTENV
ncbi:sugar transferase [Persicobacter diffluens]|uniref:Glycosyl transferase n=1 Tax=Persicobacter diffluens TaxID=981 RepID=A0AAN4VYX5_9BACT|nr:glycosyl transferase [Persicobacter diffluens]